MAEKHILVTVDPRASPLSDTRYGLYGPALGHIDSGAVAKQVSRNMYDHIMEHANLYKNKTTNKLSSPYGDTDSIYITEEPTRNLSIGEITDIVKKHNIDCHNGGEVLSEINAIQDGLLGLIKNLKFYEADPSFEWMIVCRAYLKFMQDKGYIDTFMYDKPYHFRVYFGSHVLDCTKNNVKLVTQDKHMEEMFTFPCQMNSHICEQVLYARLAVLGYFQASDK